MLALLAQTLLVSACVSGTVSDYCAIATPIHPDDRDLLTDGTVLQILTHNETWARLCSKE